jgi:hypothetical protein
MLSLSGHAAAATAAAAQLRLRRRIDDHALPPLDPEGTASDERNDDRKVELRQRSSFDRTTAAKFPKRVGQQDNPQGGEHPDQVKAESSESRVPEASPPQS